MLYKLWHWWTKKLIIKERKRQYELGYNGKHDLREVANYDMIHLLNQAAVHYDRGHYDEALALLQAHQDLRQTIRMALK